MALNQAATPLTCCFSLRPIHALSHRPIMIDHLFDPTPTKPETVLKQAVSFPFPVFNCDKTHFTPTFILYLDSNYYKLNQEFEGQKFLKKINDANQQISKEEVLIARPNCDFCQICRSPFTDYTSHIKDKIHQRHLQSTKGESLIKEVCKSFAKKRKIIQKQQQMRPMAKKSVHARKVKKKQVLEIDQQGISFPCLAGSVLATSTSQSS